MEEIIMKSVGQFGFPIAVTGYLLWKFTPAINNLSEAIQELAKNIHANNIRMDLVERTLNDLETAVKNLASDMNVKLARIETLLEKGTSRKGE